MKRTIGFALLVIATVMMLAVVFSGAAQAQDGKALFLAQKCNMCHSVSAAGIEATTKSEKMKGPDLSASTRDAAWTTKYLKKEVDLNGKKHPKEVKLTDAELAALVGWLEQQRKK